MTWLAQVVGLDFPFCFDLTPDEWTEVVEDAQDMDPADVGNCLLATRLYSAAR